MELRLVFEVRFLALCCILAVLNHQEDDHEVCSAYVYSTHSPSLLVVRSAMRVAPLSYRLQSLQKDFYILPIEAKRSEKCTVPPPGGIPVFCIDVDV